MTAPVIALRAWYRLVRAHRDAVLGGRRDEAWLLARRVEQAEARYRVLARCTTADQGVKEPTTAGAGAAVVECARVRWFGAGCAPYRDSARAAADRPQVQLGRVGSPRR